MCKDAVKDIYVSRYHKKVSDILYTQKLCCYPPENEASKIFVKFLTEHPEYSPNDIDLRIDSVEREEDHYGNGGGVDNTVVIFKVRDETDKEYLERIQDAENVLIDAYAQDMRNDMYRLLGKLNINDIPRIEREAFLQRVYKELALGILSEIYNYL